MNNIQIDYSTFLFYSNFYSLLNKKKYSQALNLAQKQFLTIQRTHRQKDAIYIKHLVYVIIAELLCSKVLASRRHLNKLSSILFKNPFLLPELYNFIHFELLTSISTKVAYGKFLKQIKYFYDFLGESLDDAELFRNFYLELRGTIELKMARYAEAAMTLQESLNGLIYSQGNISYLLAVSHMRLGWAQHNLGFFSEAQENIKRAIFLDPENREAAQYYIITLLRNNDYIKTINILRKVLDNIDYQSFSDVSFLPVLFSLYSEYYSQQKKLFKSIEALLKAQEICENLKAFDTVTYTSIMSSLGKLHWKIGDTETALGYFEKCITTLKRIIADSDIELLMVKGILAKLYSDTSNFPKANKLYLSLIKVNQVRIYQDLPFLDEKERDKFVNFLKQEFDDYHSFIAKNHREQPELIEIGLNFRIAEKGLLLSSKTKLNEHLLRSGDSKLVKLYTDLKIEKTLLNKLEVENSSQTTVGKGKRTRLEQKIKLHEKELMSKLKIDSKTLRAKVEWTTIRNQLNNNEAVVEIIRYKEASGADYKINIKYMFYIIRKQSSHPDIVILEDGEKLESIAYAWYLTSIKDQSRDLSSFSFYWENIDVLLEGIDKIYISSDGIYNQVNISTLLNNKSKYVIDDKEIIYISNLRDHFNPNKARVEYSKSVCLFGNPSFDSNPSDNSKPRAKNDENLLRGFDRSLLVDLPNTEKEVQQIHCIVQSKNWISKIHLEKEFNKSNIFEVKDARILHIATHGYFINQKNESMTTHNSYFSNNLRLNNNPMINSVLFLSGANSYLKDYKGDYSDVILTAHEASTLNLEKTDLVVLSACESGLGINRYSEGVIGLQTAFLSAGANSVVTSLWKVPDEETMELMVEFYTRMLEGSDKMKALKEAQLAIKNKKGHPYYWGGFVLISK